MRLSATLLFTFLATVLVAQAATPKPGSSQFWKDRERGWFWYEEPPIVEEQETVEQPKYAPQVLVPPQEDKAPELKEMEAVKKRLEDKRNMAIINPTKENIKAYVEEQELAMERAYGFADGWRRLLWEEPDLNYQTKGRPTSRAGAQAYDKGRILDRNFRIATISKTHGLDKVTS